ncbi:R-spondin-3 [Heterocephalus glaber]|uniref:R-spondin-3 n=1 Tax=Heterocephalus glaber TaxID=10181 RepID=G5C4S5_HETGA|nr:R-spondin-3 [Heterocephalus glaber]
MRNPVTAREPSDLEADLRPAVALTAPKLQKQTLLLTCKPRGQKQLPASRSEHTVRRAPEEPTLPSLSTPPPHKRDVQEKQAPLNPVPSVSLRNIFHESELCVVPVVDLGMVSYSRGQGSTVASPQLAFTPLHQGSWVLQVLLQNSVWTKHLCEDTFNHSKDLHPSVSQGCQGGCATCSDYNGCLSCKPRLFFVLERIGMKQIGVCLSSCPSGYYGTRYPDINKCTKCKADCDTCFNKNFCTKCKSGFYLHLGKCLDNCPEGLEASNHTMECISIVHCEAGEWSPWSPCTKKGKTCGFKRGTETRVRDIIQHPSAKGNLCPPTSETRKCTVQRKKCQKGERGKKGRERKRKKLNKEESKEAVPDNKGLESSRDTLEQRENKDKQQQKKRKVQDKQQKSVSVSTVH